MKGWNKRSLNLSVWRTRWCCSQRSEVTWAERRSLRTCWKSSRTRSQPHKRSTWENVDGHYSCSLLKRLSFPSVPHPSPRILLTGWRSNTPQHSGRAAGCRRPDPRPIGFPGTPGSLHTWNEQVRAWGVLKENVAVDHVCVCLCFSSVPPLMGNASPVLRGARSARPADRTGEDYCSRCVLSWCLRENRVTLAETHCLLSHFMASVRAPSWCWAGTPRSSSVLKLFIYLKSGWILLSHSCNFKRTDLQNKLRQLAAWSRPLKYPSFSFCWFVSFSNFSLTWQRWDARNTSIFVLGSHPIL